MAATTKRTKKKSTPKSPKVLDTLGLGVKRKKALLSKSPHLGALTISELHELQLIGAKAVSTGKKKGKPGVAGSCGVCCSTL